MDDDDVNGDDAGEISAEDHDDSETDLYYSRSRRSAALDRLRARIKLLHRQINKPLADIVRDCVLYHLPARSLLRLRAVDPSWASFVSSPIFAHTQSLTHRSISGAFFRPCHGAAATYAHFLPAAAHMIPEPVLSFLPDASHCSVLFSSHGLVLFFNQISLTYYVCNPINAAWIAVPSPPCDPGPEPPAVLVISPSVYNFRPDFSIVIPFRIGDDCGIIGFQTFSSSAGGWWVSNETCAAESVCAVSGVVAGGVVYWRTTMLTVIKYDPKKDSVRMVPWPMGHRASTLWEIGEMGGVGRLYCVAVTYDSVEVYKLLGEFDEWVWIESLSIIDVSSYGSDDEDEAAEEEKMKGNELWEVEPDGRVALKQRPWPLRFQGAKMEILLWAEGNLVAVDLASKQVRTAAAPAGPPGHYYVPHVSTLAAVPFLGDLACSSSTIAAEGDGQGQSRRPPKARRQ
ncbi:uncharacterized protein LOC122055393 [Zingiber officinale]|uniref:uncharacterized protein LOC122055393 n=1 Tax=Zingiber officinale TaxID=94328 RepID=UPI001C4B9E42|nr:uncharacterized protein LOC122055393 [Zingiber officinale]